MEVDNIGKIHKLDIRHDNALINSGWFLDRVEVIDEETEERLVFHCERWLAKSEDDGEISRY